MIKKASIAQPSIRDLAIIGDRRTCALLDKNGTINWYCPNRFDKPSVFSQLIDENGGYWTVDADKKTFRTRKYMGNSAILVTGFSCATGVFNITDWMSMHPWLRGVFRKFSKSAVAIHNKIVLKPGYGLKKGIPKLIADNIVSFKNGPLYLKTSHPIQMEDDVVSFTIPPLEEGWAVLLDNDNELDQIANPLIQDCLKATKNEWQKVFGTFDYEGPFKDQMYQSFRAIKLLTYVENGGIIAAATTSLPEVIGAERNYDYRYVWLRDTAMIVSALLRANVSGNEEMMFLDFLCGARSNSETKKFIPFYNLDFTVAPGTKKLPLTGYKKSKPVQVGNGANEQLQLDANANVLLAAKQIYNRYNGKPHWNTIEEIADYLASNWSKKDHGIWEEHLQKHFTSSKVIVAKSLEFIAAHATSSAQEKKWLKAASAIRKFVSENCMTKDGAYAVYAGSDEVDITAALYPVWLYDEPDSACMQQTVKRLEAEYATNNLYRRRLELFDSKKEGVFLASCFWMAQYYIMCDKIEKARRIINAALAFSNDLGFFAEEGALNSGEMLGNFPQTFVHASFMGVVIDLNAALKS